MNKRKAKLQARILALMQHKDYTPSNPRQIADDLDIRSKDDRYIRRTLKTMRKQGLTSRSKNGRWHFAGKSDLVRARVYVHNSTVATCVPIDEPCENVEEFFIPKRYLNGAIDQDIALITPRPTRPHRRKMRRKSNRSMRRIAEVVSIEAHGRSKIPGTLVKNKDGYAVRPDIETAGEDVRVLSVNIDGVSHSDLLGHKVVTTLDDPSKRLGARNLLAGNVVEDLGPADAPGVDIASIARQHGIEKRFDPEIESATSKLSKSVSKAELSAREDLRGLTTVTIDPVNARDFDDAISIERAQHGDWLLYVHIADVAHYVKPGSPIDVEARSRGNSTYLVDRVLPMLPEHLTNDVCSLRPDVDSLTHTVRIEFNPQGEVVGSSTFRSVIHSDARIVYEEAQSFFDGNSKHGLSGKIGGKLALMRKLALILRRKRISEGSLDFSMPDVRCVLDKRGECVDIVKQGGSEACRVIEEFMLAANRIVAGIINASGRAGIYRVHDEPDEQEWSELMAELKVLGVDPLPHEFSEINAALEEMADTGGAHAFNIRILRTMKKAMYSADSTGHFGLGFDCYTHFTSPIRRYADLLVHRLLNSIEQNDNSYKPGKDELKKIARHCTDTEIESQYAERESVDLKRISYFKNRLRQGETGPYRGVIIATIPKGILVELEDSLQSGLIPFAAMRDDHYSASKDGLIARGQRSGRVWRVGQRLDLLLSRVDEEKCQVDFHLD